MPEKDTKYILALNARAHSVKYTYFDYYTLQPVHTGRFENIGLQGTIQLKDNSVYVLGNDLSYLDCINYLLTSEHNIPGEQLAGIGHRIIHGGSRFKYPVLVDADTRLYLKSICNLAPSHLPQNLAAINVCNYVLKEKVPQVGVFDTEFHSNLTEAYTRFPIPNKYFEQGIRKYGFHGIAYESIVQQIKTIKTDQKHIT